MSVYTIDFSEPLVSGFEIPAGGFNGPGGAASNTSLRLHGRGALEWGEAVNEDLVRLTENFASASPPPNPISGQLWTEVKLYHFDGTNYWRFDPNISEWEATALTAPTVTSLPEIGPSTPVGQYCVYNGILYGLYVKSPEPTASWIPRSCSTGIDRPPKPEQTLKVYDKFKEDWITPQSVIVTNTAGEPSSPIPGTLWYNTSTQTLYIWDPDKVGGPGWQSITTSGSPTTNLNLGSSELTFTHMFLNEGDGDSVSTGPDIRFTGEGMFASETNMRLVIDSDNNASGNFVVSKGATTSNSTTDLLTIFNNGEVRANTPNYQTLVTNSNTLVNKKYVDDAIAGATSGNTATVYTTTGPHTYEAGDIAVVGGKIYIALAAGTSTVPGGQWKQVWPATYS